MKHYRILERKVINDITNGIGKKEYIIQYLKKFIFGLYYWKKVNGTIYYKYEEAFNEAKKLMLQSDYEDEKYGYHYIDAYKIFKGNNLKEAKTTPFNLSATAATDSKETLVKETKETLVKEPKEILVKEPKNKAVFIQKQSSSTKTNKTVFIPRK